MSLLNPPVETRSKSRVVVFTVTALVFVLAVVLWFTFRYYPEKKATERFFDAVVAGDTAKAYELWKPSASYRMSDFTADWGPNGYYGPVKSYKIMSAKQPRKSTSIAVNVAISPYTPLPDQNDAQKSSKTRTVTLWILPSDKSISFPPPFE
jgi:hypothetical protein